jgi:hypothetical protein
MRAYSSLCIALPAAALFVSVASAQPQPKPKWTMNSDSKEVSLVYGDDSEESDLIFSCKPRSNSVHIFIGETDASLKPNQKATASLSAGSASASISGKTIANELAGVPSFIGELSATDPLFDALTGAPAIAIKVAKTAKSIPLKTMGSKAAAFGRACRKT